MFAIYCHITESQDTEKIKFDISEEKLVTLLVISHNKMCRIR